MNTAAAAAAPLIEQQASIAQLRVRATRAELRTLLFEEDNDADVFPRSATMRLLLNSTSRRTAGAVLSLVLLKVAPGFARALKAVPMSILMRVLFRTVR
jgi:hypothetical protein